MSEQVTNQINCLDASLNAKLDELIAAVNDAASPDYTDLFNTVIASLQNLETNTDGIEASLTNIDTSTAASLVQLENILAEVSAINENTDQVEALLQSIIDSLASILNKEVFQFDSQGDVCANVDGAPQYVTPVVQYNTTTGAEVGVFYRDRLGVRITAPVTVADPCDCKCVDCSSDEPEKRSYDLTDALGIDSKIDYDNPANDDAFTDITGSWTAADLVELLNSASTAQPSPYENTVWQVDPNNPNAICVVSGAEPTSIDFVSIPVSVEPENGSGGSGTVATCAALDMSLTNQGNGAVITLQTAQCVNFTDVLGPLTPVGGPTSDLQVDLTGGPAGVADASFVIPAGLITFNNWGGTGTVGMTAQWADSGSPIVDIIDTGWTQAEVTVL